MNQQNLSSFIWSVADLLRGDYKQSEYGKVILPFTVLRRLDCVLEGTRAAALKELAKRQAAGLNPEPFVRPVVLALNQATPNSTIHKVTVPCILKSPCA